MKLFFFKNLIEYYLPLTISKSIELTKAEKAKFDLSHNTYSSRRLTARESHCTDDRCGGLGSWENEDVHQPRGAASIAVMALHRAATARWVGLLRHNTSVRRLVRCRIVQVRHGRRDGVRWQTCMTAGKVSDYAGASRQEMSDDTLVGRLVRWS